MVQYVDTDCQKLGLLCLICEFCGMANPWKEPLVKAGIAEEVAQKVVETYAYEAVFCSCFRTEMI